MDVEKTFCKTQRMILLSCCICLSITLLGTTEVLLIYLISAGPSPFCLVGY